MTTEISVPEVTAVAIALTDEKSLERFVADLPAEQVPVFLARLLDAATNIRALTKGFERRLVADGQTGQHWEIEGREYGLFGAQAKGWKDIPNLFANLLALGVSTADLGEAVSEIRVTDLRAAVATLKERDAALDLIESSRLPKGARGAPSFKIVANLATEGDDK